GERNRAPPPDRHEERLVDQGGHDGGEPLLVELPLGLQADERFARSDSRREGQQHRQRIELHVLGRARDRAGRSEPAGALDLGGQGTGYHIRNVPLHRPPPPAAEYSLQTWRGRGGRYAGTSVQLVGWDMQTRTLRSPRYGERPWATIMLSSIRMSPSCQGKARVSA